MGIYDRERERERERGVGEMVGYLPVLFVSVSVVGHDGTQTCKLSLSTTERRRLCNSEQSLPFISDLLSIHTGYNT